MVRRLKSIILLVMLFAFGLTACANPGAKSEADTPTIEITTSPTPRPLATPYALQPAAGICAESSGEMVTVNLFTDIPDPRCTLVKPDQKLTVSNQAQLTLEVSLGNYHATLAAGDTYVIDAPFGDYLAQGVHQLQVSPCCGAELWLEGK